jgi:hypothetical protein
MAGPAKPKQAVRRELDRSRVFGQVFGSDRGAVWEQDNLLFDAAGNQLEDTSGDDTFPDPPGTAA